MELLKARNLRRRTMFSFCCAEAEHSMYAGSVTAGSIQHAQQCWLRGAGTCDYVAAISAIAGMTDEAGTASICAIPAGIWAVDRRRADTTCSSRKH
eukprot:735319-Rhodomonas_salina.1